ncbi:MAG: peptidyl-prolyl cis-trans isomerase [Planctomycetota bacterium]|nr:MAG: peptidyl-prolyl cis-trans isomerase [Planctomycetota bacterium]
MPRCIFLFALITLLAGGCQSKSQPTRNGRAEILFGEKSDLPDPSGGFSLAVGDETITSNEIIGSLIEHEGGVVALIESLRPIAQRSSLEQFKKQAKPELKNVLTAKISNILLYQQAKKDAGKDIDERLEMLAKAEVRQFVAGFGGDYAKAEEELKRSGMDWSSFKEYKKREILSYSYIREQLSEDSFITHSELLDYYNKMKDKFFSRPAMIKFEAIDIEAEELDVTDANQSRQEMARSLANDLLEQIKAGQDLGQLAQRHRGVSLVGFSRGVQPESLEKPYDILAAEVEKIEPGEVTAPIESGTHIFIMKLEAKQPKSFVPFEKVQKEVEARIIFERRRSAVEEFNRKLAEQAELGGRDRFSDFCLEQIYQICNE